MAILSNLVVRITGNTANFTKALDKAETRADRFSKKAGAAFKTLAKGAAGLGVAAVGAVAAFGANAVRNFAKTGDEIHKMALRTGFSTEQLSKLKFAAEQSGGSIDGIDRAVRRMHGTIFDAGRGLSTASEALGALGLEADELAALKPEDQFNAIAAKIGEMNDASKQAALVEDIFGRAGNELLPLLKEGEAGIKALGDEAEKLGAVFTQEQADDAAAFTDAINALKTSVAGAGKEIATELVPKLTELINYGINEVIPFLKDTFSPAFNGIKEVVDVVWKVFQNDLLPVLKEVWGYAQQTLLPAIESLWKAFSNDLLPALKGIWNFIKPVLLPALEGLAKFFTTNLAGAIGTISQAISAVGRLLRGDFVGAWNAIKGVVVGVINTILSNFNMIANALPGLKPIPLIEIRDVAIEAAPEVESVATSTTNVKTVMEETKAPVDQLKEALMGHAEAATAVGEAHTSVTEGILAELAALQKSSETVKAIVSDAMGQIAERKQQSLDLLQELVNKEVESYNKRVELEGELRVVQQQANDDLLAEISNAVTEHLNATDERVEAEGRVTEAVNQTVEATKESVQELLRVQGVSADLLRGLSNSLNARRPNRSSNIFSGFEGSSASFASVLGQPVPTLGGIGMPDPNEGLGRQTGVIGDVRDDEALVGSFASGGRVMASGRALVGERGREIVDLPRGSVVHSNRDSERMLRGGTTVVHYHASGRMSERSERDNFRKFVREAKRDGILPP